MSTPRKKYKITAKCFDKRGRLISVGENNYRKTHPIQQYFATKAGMPKRIFLHAEIAALVKAGDKSIHKIVIERFDHIGNPINAEPCDVCKAAISAYGVKYVEYTC